MDSKLVILDRDGVINEDSSSYVRSVDDLTFIPGSLDAISIFKEHGWKVAIATNQSGIARGYFTIGTLESIHAKLMAELARKNTTIDLICFCPHGPDDGCSCRKPRTGMLRQISEYFDRSLDGVPFIGDSVRDIIAGKSCGCRPILVLTGNGREVQGLGPCREVEIYSNLLEAAKNLVDEQL